MRPVLLVTGGSRGIGAAICRLAAARGYDIALTYRTEAAAAASVARECAAHGARCEIIQADAGNPGDVARLFAELDKRMGRLDALVNNAGITGRAGLLADADPEMIRSCIDVNVTGAILIAREAVKRMSRRLGGRGGVIVNVSSAAATLGSPGDFVWYAASKAAIDAFTIGLGKEVASDGIRVNAVAPGIIETGIHASAGKPNRVAELGPQVPIGRAGSADEVAEAIYFLMSEASSYVTGTTLRVTGGR